MKFSHLSGLALLVLGSQPVEAQLAADMKLENAGFVMRIADTPQKLERLRRLPPRTFVSRTGANGRYYLYAEPDVCKCVFLGDERALRAYRDMRRAGLPQPDVVGPSGINAENQIIQDMDVDAGFDVPFGDILDYRY
jgi:hypothetical protein